MTLSPFAPAWLSGEARALALLPDHFRRESARRHVVDAAAAQRVDPSLLQALRDGHANHLPSEARQRNLELLGRPGTVAVVTGQQVGLFLGPLYTLYKAAAAIVNARALAEESGRPCVPVFWLQTEDNDVAEVDRCFVPRSAGEPLRLSLNIPDAAHARVPVSETLLGPGVVTALDDLRAELAGEPFFDEHLDLLTRAYRPDATLPQAFAQVLANLFADEGLLVLDPRDPRVARLAAPVHRRCIQEAQATSRVLTERAHALTEAAFTVQVHVRENAPLCFFSPDGEAGPRYRLEPAGPEETWKLVGHPSGARVTTLDLLTWLEKEPRRFTSSALLRPLIQDTLLPTAAYVGGPGEVAYLAQLPPLYQHLGRPMPLVVHRARFRITDDRTRALLDKLLLSTEAATGPREAVLARLLTDASLETEAAAQARVLGLILPEINRMGERMVSTDATLERAVVRTRENVTEVLQKFAARYVRALGRKDAVVVERLDRARDFLVPHGEPQERVLGMSYFACRLGNRPLTEMILLNCEPFSEKLKDLVP